MSVNANWTRWNPANETELLFRVTFTSQDSVPVGYSQEASANVPCTAKISGSFLTPD